jgi:Na+-translocating ferredoxin:NAD+ oxidoreductase RnfC subunit
MRSLAFTGTGKEYWNEWAELCCACGLCTLYACPEELFPKEACDQSKAEMRQAGLQWSGPAAVQPHPLHEGRRVPIKTLMRKLHVEQYDHPARLRDLTVEPSRAVLPLKQGAGSPNVPLVKAGQRVTEGQALGQVPEKSLGALVHAPFAGKVVAVNHSVVLEREL